MNWCKAKFFSDITFTIVVIYLGINYLVPCYEKMEMDKAEMIEYLSSPRFCSLACNMTTYNISYEGVNITHVEKLYINLTCFNQDVPRNPDGSLVTPDDLATGRYGLWKMCNETGACKFKFKIA